MWFLTKVWLPWWLLVAVYEWSLTPHHTVQERGSMAILMFAYGAVASLITLVYVCARAFRRATSDGRPPR